MTIKLVYNSSGNYLLATIEGALTRDDFSQAMDEITSSEKYSPEVNTIWDLRKLYFGHMDEDFERSIIAIRYKTDKKRANAKLALVVADDLSFGMARMYQTLSEMNELSQEIKIFRKAGDARDWVLTA
jgi:hypothetical protein